jgi:3-oxoacyl-[acyl-carrier-protein] synthase III
MSFSIESIDYILGEMNTPIEDLCLTNKVDYERLMSRSGFTNVYKTSTDLLDFFSKVNDLKFEPNSGDFVIFVNQSMHQLIPGKVPLIFNDSHNAEKVFFLEISDGCSGFVRSLILGDALLFSNPTRSVYIVCAEAYSKHFRMIDNSVSAIFSDAISVTKLIFGDSISIIDSVIDNDFLNSQNISIQEKENGHELTMKGSSVLNWSKRVVSAQIKTLTDRHNLELNQLSEIVLHQGSRVVVESILDSLGNSYRFPVSFSASRIGNTVSSSIPIHMSMQNAKNGRFLDYGLSTISGFGVGLSSITLLVDVK